MEQELVSVILRGSIDAWACNKWREDKRGKEFGADVWV